MPEANVLVRIETATDPKALSRMATRAHHRRSTALCRIRQRTFPRFTASSLMCHIQTIGTGLKADMVVGRAKRRSLSGSPRPCAIEIQAVGQGSPGDRAVRHRPPAPHGRVSPRRIPLEFQRRCDLLGRKTEASSSTMRQAGLSTQSQGTVAQQPNAR